MKRLVLLAPLLSGCLSIVPGMTFQEIEMKQQPDGIRVEVLADGKRVAETITPGRVVLRRAPGYMFRFSKAGYRTEVVQAWASPGSRSVASCLLGIFTVWIGFFIDSATGAITEIDISKLNITLTPEDSKKHALLLRAYQSTGPDGESQIVFQQQAL